MEEILVQKIISIAWRMRRLLIVEQALDKSKEGQINWEKAHGENYFPFNVGQMETINKYEVTLDRSMYRALKELKALQKDRKENGFVS